MNNWLKPYLKPACSHMLKELDRGVGSIAGSKVLLAFSVSLAGRGYLCNHGLVWALEQRLGKETVFHGQAVRTYKELLWQPPGLN
jgi:hypothetical protein